MYKMNRDRDIRRRVCVVVLVPIDLELHGFVCTSMSMTLFGDEPKPKVCVESKRVTACHSTVCCEIFIIRLTDITQCIPAWFDRSTQFSIVNHY